MLMLYVSLKLVKWDTIRQLLAVQLVQITALNAGLTLSALSVCLIFQLIKWDYVKMILL